MKHKFDVSNPDLKKGVAKVYKYNALIQSALDVKNLSDYDSKVFNYVLSELQKCVRNIEAPIWQTYTFKLKYKDFKAGIYNGRYVNRWRNTIKKSITRLTNAKITLKNFEIPDVETGQAFCKDSKFLKIKQANLSLILESYFYKDGIELSFSKSFVYFAWLKKNYTHIKAPTINLKSKYAQKISELIEYGKGIHKSRQWSAKEMIFNYDTFCKALGLDSKKSPSVNLNLINFKKVVLKELKKIYPSIEFEFLKKSNYLIIKGATNGI